MPITVGSLGRLRRVEQRGADIIFSFESSDLVLTLAMKFLSLAAEGLEQVLRGWYWNDQTRVLSIRLPGAQAARVIRISP